MQVDKQLFSVNVVELTNKKALVWPDMADKDKGKILSLVVPAP
jgi:short-subunit dehydrogenase